MTHFPARRDAYQAGGEVKGWQNEIRACNGCGAEFRPARPWQQQCSSRCRQRAYVQRQAATLPGYYGA